MSKGIHKGMLPPIEFRHTGQLRSWETNGFQRAWRTDPRCPGQGKSRKMDCFRDFASARLPSDRLAPPDKDELTTGRTPSVGLVFCRESKPDAHIPLFTDRSCNLLFRVRGALILLTTLQYNASHTPIPQAKHRVLCCLLLLSPLPFHGV